MTKIPLIFSARRRRRWRRSLRAARRKLARVPRAVQIAGGIAIVLLALIMSNFIYHVIHKPTELFFFVGHRLDKEPAETRRHDAPPFRTYATRSITPELPGGSASRISADILARTFSNTLASIWRTRSREMPNSPARSSSVAASSDSQRASMILRSRADNWPSA